MPDAEETESYEMLREDWGSGYLITRVPGTAHPYKAARRDDPAVILTAADPEALRQLIRADYLARPVPGRSRRDQPWPARRSPPGGARRALGRCRARPPGARADHL